MKKPWKIAFAVLVFLGLTLGISLLSVRLGSEGDLAAYKKVLADQGVKLHISEVLPPPVPAGQNGADLVGAALKLLPPEPGVNSNSPPTMLMVAPGKAMVGWQQPQIIYSVTDGCTNSWDNAALALEMARPALDLLRQAARFPALNFHLEYQKGPETPLPHLKPILASVDYLGDLADEELHGGDPAAATTNLCAILSLVRGLQDERTISSQLTRMTMTAKAFAASWELLQATNVPDADLSKLRIAWEQVEFIGVLEKTLLMDEAMVNETLMKLRTSPAGYSGYSPAFGGSTGTFWEDVKRGIDHATQAGRETGAQIMWQNSLKDSTDLRFLHDAQDILKTVREMSTNQLFQPAYSRLTSRILLADKVAGFDVFADKVLNTSSATASLGLSQRRLVTLKLAIAAEVSRRLVITAIALKRFQLRHAKFPDTLAELTPEFLTAIPLDPMNGQPMHYSRNIDGTYGLYSVGENGIDDGGDPTGTGSGPYDGLQSGARDWVWPQPATEAEIEKYYAAQPAKEYMRE